jgi:uncharacterized protein YjeT (DUF2065 family)
MENFLETILIAFALIFVIEGLLYALFPDAMKRVLAMALTLPPSSLRRFGFVMVLCGFCMVALFNAVML